MSEKYVRVGQRVQISGKNVSGVISYVGLTSFAIGKWVGVILDDPVGKNNGSIRGQAYFTCAENHGMFVRPTQLVAIDDAGNPIEDASPDEKPRSRLSSKSKLQQQTSSARKSGVSSVRSVSSAKPTTIRRKSPPQLRQSGMSSSSSTMISSTSSISRRQNSMASSASSSRISLAGSRQSLSGSRSQLASPATDRPPQGPAPTAQSSTEKLSDRKSSPESLNTSKRASFIETGFLETLKPQFTPGQSLTSPSPAMTAEEKLHILQQQQENDELKTQVRDLGEKLETLKLRRAEDKERLKEYDRMKTQFDQLQEFKSKIMDAQSQLQRELQRAKQDAKDAIEARDQHQEEMSELAENVEMITLDKEMAEEKADTLQLELEQTKERIEELTLDLEILRAEMQNKSGSTTDGGDGGVTAGGGVSSYEFKQLDQQNQRLRETLVRLRDLSAHEKHEIQKITKELDTKKSEVLELQRTKEKLSQRIDEMESQIVELQELVDAALGAEEMVEQLVEKKLELEDKVKLLEDEVSELEALNEVQEQLIESNHELEMDFREELDMAHAAKRESVREKEAALETILDRDQTIMKFRELVQKLNDQLQELREKVNSESSKPTKDITETIDFKQMFAETKAYTRAIDLQLRQIELSQSTEHVKYLSAFMPDTFMNRGGDHDGILVVLLVSRLVFKSGIIVTQARERFSALSSVDRASVLQGHIVNQFEFKSRLLYFVHNLQCIMHQFLFTLNACKPDLLLKAGASLPEMLAQEKIIDGVIELLKANQLDENSSLDNLEKCVSFFHAMYSVLFHGEELMNETQLVRDCVASIGSACDSVTTDCAIIQALIKGGDETSDSGLLMQWVTQNVETIRQQLKLIKRRLPQDQTITKCQLSQNTITNLKQTSENLGKAMVVMNLAAKQIIIAITVEGDANADASHAKIWETLSAACERVYEQDDRGPTQNLRTVLSTTNTDMSQFAQYLLDHEYEIMAATTANTEKPAPPIILRAQFVKKQLEETKTLTATLENREAEIRQLKLAAKMKQNELSEMQIRKDLAEKKLSVLQNDHEINTEKLQRKIEEVTQLLKKKEKEFEETMDHLQNDIDSLESERGALREKLKGYSSKKGDLKSTTAFDITASSPYIVQELSLLKKAFNSEREERLRLQSTEYRNMLNAMEPIYVPQQKDERIVELEKDLAKVKYDYVMSLVKGAAIPATNTNISKILQEHKIKQKLARQEIKSKAENLAAEVLDEYLQRKPHRAVIGDFSKFPTNELSKALNTRN